MAELVTFREVERLAVQLLPPEQLKLVARICEHLSATVMEGGVEQVRNVRLQLAEELLAECDDIENDLQGEVDAAHDIRQLRAERMSQWCQSGVSMRVLGSNGW